MLGQVSGNHQDESIKPVKVRDLSMRTDNVPVDHLDQAELLEQPYGPPECSLAAPGVLGDLRLFGICRAIVGIQSEEPHSYFSLSRRQAERLLEAVPDMVELFDKQGAR